MNQVVETKGRVSAKWADGRIRIEIDMSRRMTLAVVVLMLYLYAPHLLEIMRRVFNILR